MLPELFGRIGTSRYLPLVPTLFFAMSLSGCGPECEDRNQYAEDYVMRVLESNQRCNYDNECTVMNVTTSCSNLCPQAVNIEGITQVDEAVTYADEIWCGDAGSQGCGFLTPECPAIDLVFCDVSAGGICTAVYN